MTAQLHYRYEIADDTATLYFAGTMSDKDSAMLHRIFAAIPAEVRLLRIDLHALGSIDQRILDLLHPFLRQWRVRRGGAFRVTVIMASAVKNFSEYDSAVRGVGFPR